MKAPLVWVTASLAAAIVVTVTLLIATGMRGDRESFPAPLGQLEVQTVTGAVQKRDDIKVIFRQKGPQVSGERFGRRIAQADDGNLFTEALTDQMQVRPSLNSNVVNSWEPLPSNLNERIHDHL